MKIEIYTDGVGNIQVLSEVDNAKTIEILEAALKKEKDLPQEKETVAAKTENESPADETVNATTATTATTAATKSKKK